MAQRQRRGIGGVGGLGRRGEPEPHLDHLLHLGLVGATPAGDRVLHLVRRVLHDLAAERRGFGERQPAGLADAHRRAHVDLEEDLLDGDDVGSELGEQGDDLGLQRGEALRQRIGRRRAQNAERHRLGCTRAEAVEHGIPATGEAGVDPQDALRNEHKFVL